MTSSGKTTLAKSLAREYRKRGYGVLVLDPLLDSGWSADLLTDNPDKFLKSATASRGCKLFCDESGETIGRYNDSMFWLATRARHFGHQSHFITQRVVQLNKTVRDQCVHLFAFRISTIDAKTLSIDWSNDMLINASRLDKFHFFQTSRFGKTEHFVVTLNGAMRVMNGSSNLGRNSSSSVLN